MTEKIRLDDWQRAETTSRILHDAELLKRGATVTKTGRIALANVQLEYVNLSENEILLGDIAADRSEPELDSTDEQLDRQIDDLWTETFAGDGHRIPRALKRASIFTVRDLLVAGRRYVETRRSVGEKSLDRIDLLLQSNAVPVEWANIPSPDYVATFCSRLSQVNAAALGIVGRGKYLFKPISVLEVLDMPFQDRLQNLELFGSYERYGIDRKDVLAHLPAVFAMRFDQAIMNKNLEADPLYYERD